MTDRLDIDSFVDTLSRGVAQAITAQEFPSDFAFWLRRDVARIRQDGYLDGYTTGQMDLYRERSLTADIVAANAKRAAPDA